MDIDPKTYPSRTFARFTAHNQLMADLTGQPVVASVQRLGGKTFMQEALPDGEAPSVKSGSEASSSAFRMNMSVDMAGQQGRDRQAPDLSGETPESDLETSLLEPSLDEALFAEIVKTTLNPTRFPDLYRSCGTQEAAMEVEALVAAEIVSVYRRIKQNQDCSVVQGLNKLL